MRHALKVVTPLLLLGVFSHAQNSNGEIHMRATVQAIVPLTRFAGHVTPVAVDPRFAMTVHVESVIPADSSFPEGAVVTLSIHSPTCFSPGNQRAAKPTIFPFIALLN